MLNKRTGLKKELLPYVVDAKIFYEAEALMMPDGGKKQNKLKQLDMFDMLLMAYLTESVSTAKHSSRHSVKYNMIQKLKCAQQRVELYLKIKERDSVTPI